MSDRPAPLYQWVHVEPMEDAVLVSFRTTKILDEQVAEDVGDELFALCEWARHVVVSFGTIEFISSAFLGKLITLHRRLHEQGGRLVLCSIAPDIREVFQITRLVRFFAIVASVGDALPLLGDRRVILRCPFVGCGNDVELPLATWIDSGYRVHCPSCECRYDLVMDGGTDSSVARVANWVVPTYPGRSLRARIAAAQDGSHAIELGGECDLYVADALDRLVQSLTSPVHVVLDVSRLTSLTSRGAERLEEVALRCRQAGSFAVQDKERKEAPAFSLPPSLVAALAVAPSNASRSTSGSTPTGCPPVVISIRHVSEVTTPATPSRPGLT